MSEESIDDFDDFLGELPESEDVSSLLGVPSPEDDFEEDTFSSESDEFEEYDALDDALDGEFDDAGYGVPVEARASEEFDSEDGEFDEDFLDELPEGDALEELLFASGGSDLDPGAVDSVSELLSDQSKLSALISSLGRRPGSAAAQDLDLVEAIVESPTPGDASRHGIGWSGQGKSSRGNRQAGIAVVGCIPVNDFLPSVNWSGSAEGKRKPAAATATATVKAPPTIEW